ncbi:MAG: bifunctional [glutamine synthetase] adenylyltransferase/[glutamine synthetase]-adenylyl-L-tyrosine phosphorylase [Alphaproteobacteria bacterium]
MANFTLFENISDLPVAFDQDRARIGMENWLSAGGDSGLTAAVEALRDDSMGEAFLQAMFGNSPFLGHCILRNPDFMIRLAEDGPAPCFDSVLGDLPGDPGDDANKVMERLRVAKGRLALLVAAADITNLWSLEQVTGALSRFAEAALGAATAHLLRAAANAGDLRLADHEDPETGSGLTILGLGKLGAGELNYSSDIDLMVLYDPAVAQYIGRDGAHGAQPCFVRMTRQLVRLMQERTAHGYVFRTDLRLRPDPGATPPALSVEAAETYYESLGQNWERAAMIKARPVAGDRAVGDAFVTALVPFIWRKNLDFAAIEDIHSIKRQINAHHGSATIAVAGHNIKVGRGGIREIEFFAQTQQLIWGGREPALRRRPTVEALAALAEAGRIDHQAAEELTAAYRYLRRVEHRLQMINDAQTHTMPEDPAEIDALAVFLGYKDGDAFAQGLTLRLELVERHYAELFEEEAELAPAGNLVFTGTEDDLGTLATLAELGFADGAAVGAVVRGWHHGRYRAVRSTRAREILTELMPTLLGALARTANPDAALHNFNEFLSRLPAGVQLFSLFHARPTLLDLVAEIMGTAPRLAERLSHNAGLLDGVLSGDFDAPLPGADALTAELGDMLDQARDFEDVLDISRRWAHDREFQIGVQMLRGQGDTDRLGATLADLADAVLRAIKPRVEDTFAEAHGRVPGAGLAVVGLGNLGGREMTISSDLDLTFIYDSPEGVRQSDGAKPLLVSHYFARLSQRLVNALTALTGEGRLYEIDMRLRPSGSTGPVASEIASFVDYQRQAAWTWEHMALTRARVVAGPDDLATRVEAAIGDILHRSRDADTLLADVASMRQRMDTEHHIDVPWKTKYMRGGLVGLEFIAEYLQLRHGAEHPAITAPNTVDAFRRLNVAGLLGSDHAAALISASLLMRRVRGMLRLTVDGVQVEHQSSDALRAALARTGEAADFDDLRDKLLAAQASVRKIYARLIDEPAAKLST